MSDLPVQVAVVGEMRFEILLAGQEVYDTVGNGLYERLTRLGQPCVGSAGDQSAGVGGASGGCCG